MTNHVKSNYGLQTQKDPVSFQWLYMDRLYTGSFTKQQPKAKFFNQFFFLHRLNYPFRMQKWHHVCSSWNGKTGEWQVWIKAERVGRGFHNRVS